MRVLLAGLAVWVCMLGAVALLRAVFGSESLPWWAAPLVAAAMLGAVGGALLLFNRRGNRPTLRVRPLQETIAELEGQDLLERQPFRATRAFAVEEFEDEGSHYFIELADGSVLYLSGQYLYGYEPITDDPDQNQVRLFPCTEFTVTRHRTEGYVVHIQCGGAVLEPELVARPFNREDFRRGIPEDGQIIIDRDFESLKRERAAVRAAGPSRRR